MIQTLIVSFAIFFSLFCSNTFASDQTETPQDPDKPTIIGILNEIDLLLEGELKNLVLAKQFDSNVNQAITSIAESVEKAERSTHEILLTSYKLSSKEFKNNCNFLQINIYFRDIQKSFVDLKKCNLGCSDQELSRIKNHLSHDYSDLQIKVKKCWDYL